MLLLLLLLTIDGLDGGKLDRSGSLPTKIPLKFIDARQKSSSFYCCKVGRYVVVFIKTVGRRPGPSGGSCFSCTLSRTSWHVYRFVLVATWGRVKEAEAFFILGIGIVWWLVRVKRWDISS